MGLPLFVVDIRYLMAMNKLANCLSQSVVGWLKMDFWYDAMGRPRGPLVSGGHPVAHFYGCQCPRRVEAFLFGLLCVGATCRAVSERERADNRGKPMLIKRFFLRVFLNALPMGPLGKAVKKIVFKMPV